MNLKKKCIFSAFSNITCGFSAFFHLKGNLFKCLTVLKMSAGILGRLKLNKTVFHQVDIYDFNKCPNHLATLKKWKRRSVKCSYPDHSHNGKMKQPVTSQMSRFILEHKGELVSVGSG